VRYLTNSRQTGHMTLINPSEDRTIKLDTQPKDSEILLVAADQVYYRIDDSLFVADIKENTLANTRLLVKDNHIWDVHWMMVK
jgi:hypothetical protein